MDKQNQFKSCSFHMNENDICHVLIKDLTGAGFTVSLNDSEGEEEDTYSMTTTLAPVVFSSWFLPSKDELNAMYVNLHLFAVGGFNNEKYWSSSEATIDPSTNAWYQDFNDGQQYDDNKAFTWDVRACRYSTDYVGAYSLRDAGLSGGLIFYIESIGGGLYRYYEAAPSDQSISYVWSNVATVELGITSTVIGEGINNTAEIIAQAGHVSSAAKLCDDLIL